MSIIPKGNVGGSIQATGPANVRMSANATSDHFGGAGARKMQDVGKFMMQGGAAIQKHMEEKQIKLDRAAVRDRLNQITAEGRDHMAMIQKRRGIDAAQAYQETQKWIEQKRKEATEGLQTDYRRSLFSDNFDKDAERYLSRAHAHQTKEMERFEIQTLDAENENTVQDIVQLFGDREWLSEYSDAGFSMVDEGLARITANVGYKLKGMGGEVFEKASRDERAALVVAAYGAVKDDPALARKFLDRYGKELPPKVLQGVREEVAQKERVDRARARADEIAGSDMTLDEKYEEINKIEDLDERSLARAETDRREQEKHRADAQRAKEKEDAAWKHLNDTGTIPEGVDIRMEVAMKGMLAQRARQEAEEPQRYNPAVFQKLFALSRKNPTAFMKVNLMNHYGDLDQSHYDRLEKEQKGAGDERFKTSVASAMRMAKGQFLYKLGEDTKTRREKYTSDELAEFESQVGEAVRDFIDKKDAEPTPEELNKILTSLTRESDTGGWFGDTVPYWKAQMYGADVEITPPKEIADRKGLTQFSNLKVKLSDDSVETLRYGWTAPSPSRPRYIDIFDKDGNVRGTIPDPAKKREKEEKATPPTHVTPGILGMSSGAV